MIQEPALLCAAAQRRAGVLSAALLPHPALVQRDADGGAVVGDGGSGDGVAETSADRPAEVQAQAAGLLVAAAVVAGVAFFEDARQILRRDANAGVADDERFGRFKLDMCSGS